jgi:hypothetical protein
VATVSSAPSVPFLTRRRAEYTHTTEILSVERVGDRAGRQTGPVESADGSVKYDDTFVIKDGLEPGHTTVAESFPLSADDFPDGARVVLEEVQPTAS